MRVQEYSASIAACLLSIALVVSLVQLGSTERPVQPVQASGARMLSTQTEPAESAALSVDAVSARMAYPYTVGTTQTPLGNTVSSRYLDRLGLSAQQLWQAGITLVPHDGFVAKGCGGTSGNEAVSGLAIKAGANYPWCANGLRVVPDEYQHDTKCSVHFNASESAQTATRGSTTAVLAHELGHCLYFVYGESHGIDAAYVAIRTDIKQLDDHARSEIFADDYMICEHNLNTNWGRESYYSAHDAPTPTAQDCVRLRALYDVYFPL